MRRTKVDLSYKNRTRDIVKDRFQPWQLTSKDAREGIHRFVNRSVSLMRELDTEAEYIENMFFPERMDLSEEWVLYRPYPACVMNDVYLSGEPIADILPVAESLDSMLAGNVDLLTPEFILSGVPEAESILSIDLEHTYILVSGVVTEVNLQEQQIVTSGEVDLVMQSDVTLFVDIDHRMHAIREAYRDGTVSLTLSGIPIPFTFIGTDQLTGAWNEEFDGDSNGIIGSFERARIENSIGLTQQDMSPDRWAEHDWMDANKDGTISESDYNAVMNSYPSAAPDVAAVVDVLPGRYGEMILSYERKLPKAKYLYRNSLSKVLLDDFHPLYRFASKVAYDNHTDTYFGINHDGTEVRAYRYDPINNEIVSDLLLYVPMWSHECKLVGIDCVHGTLFVGVTDGVTTKVFYGDAWGETVEEISSEAQVPTMSGEVPSAFTAMPDGYFAFLTGNVVRVFKGARDRVIEIDGVTYYNRRHSVTLADGTPLKTIPHYIFNNWDSFSFSLGFDRPWGCDNLCMKKKIMDFWQHQQGHDKLGMNYGMLRELGLDNADLVPSGMMYYLPSELTTSGEPPLWDILVNRTHMVVLDLSGETGEYLILSGDTGTIRVEDRRRIIPDEVITMSSDIVEIEGYFLDGNGDPVRLVYKTPIMRGGSDPTIKVRTYGDPVFLEDVGYTISGEPQSELISFVKRAEEENPFVYGNALTDVTPMDSNRVAEEPILETLYSPNLSGLLEGLTEVEITP